jgi:hypothetical protein
MGTMDEKQKEGWKAQLVQGLVSNLLTIPLAIGLQEAESLFDRAVLLEDHGYQEFGLDFCADLYERPEP